MLTLSQAVILAGGLGSRLGECSRQMPKPLVEAGGKPFLEYLIWNLQRYGFSRILICVGHLADRIVEHFGAGRRFGVTIEYSQEIQPLGTGGALKLAQAKLDPSFLVLNGDTLFDLNYWDLVLRLTETDAEGAIALRKVADAGRYGAVRLEDGRVVRFGEKEHARAGLINGGVYVLRNRALDLLPQGTSSLEKDLFPALAAARSLAAKAYEGFFLDIGTPESMEHAQEALPKWRHKPIVCLDRDGVLNLDHGYVHRPEQFTWVMEAREAVRWLNERGFLVCVVTNQSGIARGYYSEDEFLQFSGWIQAELRQTGAHIDAVYYCPHHPTEGNAPYHRACDCRKPAPGLLLQAFKDWEADRDRSFLIGNKEDDLQAARAAGIQGFLFPGGSLLEFVTGLPALKT